MSAIAVYPDGSASYKKADGGWAFVASVGDETAEFYGFEEDTTISVMELLAIKRSLEWLPIVDIPVRIFSDSQYAVNTLNVWASVWAETRFTATGNPPKHWVLISSIMSLLDRHRKVRSLTVAWIPGHSGHPLNERADFLAGYARKNKLTNWDKDAATR